jgi:hypothetical protein
MATPLDVSLASAFSSSASSTFSTDLFTGLHAHYTASSWDATAGMWQDVSGNSRHGVKEDWFNGNTDRSTNLGLQLPLPILPQQDMCVFVHKLGRTISACEQACGLVKLQK